MKKLWILFIVPIASLTALGQAPLQRSGVYRLGLVVAGGHTLDSPQIKGLREGLEDFGYVQGKNLLLDLILEENHEAVRKLVETHAQHKIDAIVTTTQADTRIVREVTQEIPIIFMLAGSPVRAGLIKSMASPGTNLTGLTFYTDAEENGRQLEAFKEVVPSLRRVTMLFDGRKENLYRDSILVAVRKVAAHLGIRIAEKPVSSTLEAERAVGLLTRKHTDGIFIVCGPAFRQVKKIAAVALQNKLPLFGCSVPQVAEEGALLTYAPDLYLLGNRGAWYVDQILKGVKPQQLPVQTPMKFELVINRKTAEAIGVKIHPEILMLADRVFD
jgi:putative ABC transport system substrate-binding protein